MEEAARDPGFASPSAMKAHREMIARAWPSATVNGKRVGMDLLVKIAETLGEEAGLFCAQAAVELERTAAEIANPRTKQSRTYKKAAERFKRLALWWRADDR